MPAGARALDEQLGDGHHRLVDASLNGDEGRCSVQRPHGAGRVVGDQGPSLDPATLARRWNTRGVPCGARGVRSAHDHHPEPAQHPTGPGPRLGPHRLMNDPPRPGKEFRGAAVERSERSGAAAPGTQGPQRLWVGRTRLATITLAAHGLRSTPHAGARLSRSTALHQVPQKRSGFGTRLPQLDAVRLVRPGRGHVRAVCRDLPRPVWAGCGRRRR